MPPVPPLLRGTDLEQQPEGALNRLQADPSGRLEPEGGSHMRAAARVGRVSPGSQRAG